MSDHPRKARRAALQVLYALDVSGLSPEEALSDVMRSMAEEEESIEAFGQDVEGRVRAVISDQDALDKEIQELSPTWRIDRMAAVDRNLVRLGIQELLTRKTPALIVINACVELAKEFGAASTPGFVNGLLDQCCKNHDIPITR
jgi:transcription antitermination protein NusB